MLNYKNKKFKWTKWNKKYIYFFKKNTSFLINKNETIKQINERLNLIYEL